MSHYGAMPRNGFCFRGLVRAFTMSQKKERLK